MKDFYLKDLKGYLKKHITYIFLILIMLAFSVKTIQLMFKDNSMDLKFVVYELRYLILGMVPILMFFAFRDTDKNEVMDRNMLLSDEKSETIIFAKSLSVFVITMVPISLFFVFHIFLKLIVLKTVALSVTLYIYMILTIVLSTLFSAMLQTIIRNKRIALVLNLILQYLIIYLSMMTGIDSAISMPYLIGVFPVYVTLAMLSLGILFFLIATFSLDKKRNIK